IANATFADAGTGAGEAAGWALRSACAREAIAPFAPGESVEGFERWSTWSDELGAATLAPFAPSGAAESFDAWPVPHFVVELTPGLVGAIFTDGFELAPGAASFVWEEAGHVTAAFGGAAAEFFTAWRAGDVHRVAFEPAALVAAA